MPHNPGANQPSNNPSEADEILLPHIELNTHGKSTIVLIHGAFASSKDWDLVAPFLSRDYHLLIPDLPGHGSANHLMPFSVPRSALLVSHLIRKKALDGSAHVIGHSMGSKVAINCASCYPSQVKTVFVSGFEVFPQSAFLSYLPYIVWATVRIENLVPRSLIRWLMDGTPINRTDTTVCTLDLCRQVVGAMTEVTWPESWPARTLIIAAGKAGLVPSSDHPHDAKRLMSIGNQMNAETVAFTHRDMRHPWNNQAPMLFAETASAWIEGDEMKEGFKRL